MVGGDTVGSIGAGMLVLVGVQEGDSEREARRLVERLLSYRVFPDETGRMNVSLADTGGGLLLVPQLTLAADTHKGRRASFSPCAHPDDAKRLFDHLVGEARLKHPIVATGSFGAEMKVYLINDGPVTFWLWAKPAPLPCATPYP
jgi:D-tyrosyl-tRNA(Tyr) deacylase